ncbi:MAG: SsrA-binding protein SmpB [Candidatus Pacebacteria bacterium]|jgi:SsrA-binding protein|nr:SsrA-binding protein SmpB [Candidatus Paceibacterota bacterium]MBT3511624.1 SsrA-binding protein SmpB [Candidatus Paceibacterota bacterium]MBT4004713.1 SsrA-binding protein SmpB [Candidatus Paceibacterota bacterium]MBT4359251.1 SsrA-binding protein SmpB [Candidatus Paceibacterota bacterium]MBT4681031.1 SsrA-binding protein SmpB [Candidatus Paceibacterota bacterium]
MSKLLLKNRRATYDYEIFKRYEAGIVLSGPEVKSLRAGSGSFFGSYVKFLSGEAYLLNAQITPYKFADNEDYDPKRTRKLLMHKKELADIEQLSQQKGRALIPLAFILKNRNIKLEFAVARGKKTHDKRQDLKKKDLARDSAREMSRKW